MMNGFVVAGTNSGCGKTTLTIGLMALLASRAYQIAAFKTGPDFIDPSFHSMAAGTESFNLDTYMLDKEIVSYLFQKHSAKKNTIVVEGVMGMFDGLGEAGEASTAELAQLLELPVILVVNCKNLYQSVAPIIQGFAQYDKNIRIAGVILNHVSAGGHYQFLKQYIESKTGICCLGHLPHNSEINLDSRHLGLIQANEVEHLQQKIKLLADLLAETIDVDALLNLTKLNCNETQNEPMISPWKRDLTNLRLGVARDKAFQFYYEDNLQLLRENGAQIIEFSPLSDTKLPENINALYIGGGYPEVFAKELAANSSFRAELKLAITRGMPVFAECGGLMYLTNSIETLEGENYPMCEVFDCQSKMTKSLQRFGYCNVEWNGTVARAHEFHHSILEFKENQEPAYQFNISNPTNTKSWNCGLQYKNTVAGYPHIHFYSNPEFYHNIIDLWMQKTLNQVF